MDSEYDRGNGFGQIGVRNKLLYYTKKTNTVDVR